jgi:mRNA interferase MazF
MDIGDIYTVEMPASDGHEQAGFRPAIIIQALRFEAQLSTVLIVPLTSRLAAQAFPGTFLIRPTSRNGLSVPSVALVFQLRAIDKRRLKRKLGRLSSSHLIQLQEQVKALMQLP